MKTLNEQLNELKQIKTNKKTFFTSDLHFCDERLNLYGRDLMFKDFKEVDEYIIKKWNETVNEKDLVIVCGDVSMTLDGLEKLLKCNGEKWLVKGNYDNSIKNGGTAKYEISDKILTKYFTKLFDDLEIKIGDEVIYVNHYPTNAKLDYFNIVGHIHGTWKVQRNMINVGVDAWHFTPVSEDLIKFQINGIRNHYDQNVYAGELNSNIKNRKGDFKILRAPTYDDVSFDDIYVFLAGPIQGTKEWQESFISKLKKEFENKKLTKNVIITSPRRLENFNKSSSSYEEQVNWETHYLEKAANQGVVVFWLSKETDNIKGRSYAQTTRFEIGELYSKGQNIDNFKIVVGYQEGFNGVKYIKKKFKDKYNQELLTSEKEMIKEIVKKIKERL